MGLLLVVQGKNASAVYSQLQPVVARVSNPRHLYFLGFSSYVIPDPNHVEGRLDRE